MRYSRISVLYSKSCVRFRSVTDTIGGAGVSAGVESGVPGPAALSGCAGCAGCAGLGALAAGSGIPYLAIKSLKVVLGGVIGSDGPVPSGSENCQISLAKACVLTAVSQLSHCDGSARNILCVRICCCYCVISTSIRGRCGVQRLAKRKNLIPGK